MPSSADVEAFKSIASVYNTSSRHSVAPSLIRSTATGCLRVDSRPNSPLSPFTHTMYSSSFNQHSKLHTHHMRDCEAIRLIRPAPAHIDRSRSDYTSQLRPETATIGPLTAPGAGEIRTLRAGHQVRRSLSGSATLVVSSSSSSLATTSDTCEVPVSSVSSSVNAVRLCLRSLSSSNELSQTPGLSILRVCSAQTLFTSSGPDAVNTFAISKCSTKSSISPLLSVNAVSNLTRPSRYNCPITLRRQRIIPTFTRPSVSPQSIVSSASQHHSANNAGSLPTLSTNTTNQSSTHVSAADRSQMVTKMAPLHSDTASSANNSRGIMSVSQLGVHVSSSSIVSDCKRPRLSWDIDLLSDATRYSDGEFDSTDLNEFSDANNLSELKPHKNSCRKGDIVRTKKTKKNNVVNGDVVSADMDGKFDSEKASKISHKRPNNKVRKETNKNSTHKQRQPKNSTAAKIRKRSLSTASAGASTTGDDQLSTIISDYWLHKMKEDTGKSSVSDDTIRRMNEAIDSVVDNYNQQKCGSSLAADEALAPSTLTTQQPPDVPVDMSFADGFQHVIAGVSQFLDKHIDNIRNRARCGRQQTAEECSLAGTHTPLQPSSAAPSILAPSIVTGSERVYNGSCKPDIPPCYTMNGKVRTCVCDAKSLLASDVTPASVINLPTTSIELPRVISIKFKPYMRGAQFIDQRCVQSDSDCSDSDGELPEDCQSKQNEEGDNVPASVKAATINEFLTNLPDEYGGVPFVDLSALRLGVMQLRSTYECIVFVRRKGLRIAEGASVTRYLTRRHANLPMAEQSGSDYRVPRDDDCDGLMADEIANLDAIDHCDTVANNAAAAIHLDDSLVEETDLSANQDCVGLDKTTADDNNYELAGDELSCTMLPDRKFHLSSITQSDHVADRGVANIHQADHVTADSDVVEDTIYTHTDTQSLHAADHVDFVQPDCCYDSNDDESRLFGADVASGNSGNLATDDGYDLPDICAATEIEREPSPQEVGGDQTPEHSAIITRANQGQLDGSHTPGAATTAIWKCNFCARNTFKSLAQKMLHELCEHMILTDTLRCAVCPLTVDRMLCSDSLRAQLGELFLHYLRHVDSVTGQLLSSKSAGEGGEDGEDGATTAATTIPNQQQLIQPEQQSTGVIDVNKAPSGVDGGIVGGETASCHKATSLRPANYLCNYCHRPFFNATLYGQHELSCRTQCVHVCTVCRQRFQNSVSLSLHALEHRRDTDGTYTCDLCPYSDQRLEQVQAHRRSHQQARRQAIVCHLCDRVFVSHAMLNMHMKWKHSDGPCRFCARQFSSATARRVHEEHTHLKVLPHICAQCGFRTCTRAQLRVHVRTHTATFPYRCDVCHTQQSASHSNSSLCHPNSPTTPISASPHQSSPAVSPHISHTSQAGEVVTVSSTPDEPADHVTARPDDAQIAAAPATPVPPPLVYQFHSRNLLHKHMRSVHNELTTATTEGAASDPSTNERTSDGSRNSVTPAIRALFDQYKCEFPSPVSEMTLSDLDTDSDVEEQLQTSLELSNAHRFRELDRQTDSIWSCPVCGTFFTKLWGVRAHMTLKHSGARQQPQIHNSSDTRLNKRDFMKAMKRDARLERRASKMEIIRRERIARYGSRTVMRGRPPKAGSSTQTIHGAPNPLTEHNRSNGETDTKKRGRPKKLDDSLSVTNGSADTGNGSVLSDVGGGCHGDTVMSAAPSGEQNEQPGHRVWQCALCEDEQCTQFDTYDDILSHTYIYHPGASVPRYTVHVAVTHSPPVAVTSPPYSTPSANRLHRGSRHLERRHQGRHLRTAVRTYSRDPCHSRHQLSQAVGGSRKMRDPAACRILQRGRGYRRRPLGAGVRSRQNATPPFCPPTITSGSAPTSSQKPRELGSAPQTAESPYRRFYVTGGHSRRRHSSGVDGGASSEPQPVPSRRPGNTPLATAEIARATGGGPLAPKMYCYCRAPYDERTPMIGCDGDRCEREWFHFECVGIVSVPDGTWYCPECLAANSSST